MKVKFMVNEVHGEWKQANETPVFTVYQVKRQS